MSISAGISFNWQDLFNQFINDVNLGDLAEAFKKQYAEKVESMGHVNIIVAGRTGVGKSTLINAAFRGNVAETGLGNPVTSQIRIIEKADVPVKIYDTVGLELNQDTQNASINEIQNLISEKSNTPQEMIHLIWYCVSVESERFESLEERFIRNIADNGVPTMIVATKAFDEELTRRVVADLNNRNLPIKKVIPVLARNKLEYNAYGVDQLVEYSVSLLPEIVQEAWINAIKSIRLKMKELRR